MGTGDVGCWGRHPEAKAGPEGHGTELFSSLQW